jgi:uncharacterized protein YkwD
VLVSRLRQRPRDHILLSVLLTILVVASRPDARGEQPLADDFVAVREAFLDRLNALRADRGLRPLALSEALSRVAQARAEEIAARGDAELPSTGGGEILRRATRAGYEVKFASEVVLQADGDIDEVVSSWRAGGGAVEENVLRPDDAHLGVGVAMLDEVPLYVFVFGISWQEYTSRKQVEFSDLGRMRRQMLERVNAERANRRLAPLRANATLDRIAQAHADDMLRRSYYGHQSPEGGTVRERALAGGYRLRFAGENIASGQASVDEVMDGWMASDEHRPNILSKVFSEAGFGLAIGKNKGGYQIIWVQVFGRPLPRFG